MNLVYAAMAPLFLFTASDCAELKHPVEPAPVVALSDLANAKTAAVVPQAAKIIESIEMQLSVTKAALADLLGVTRPTLYAWMRGSTIRELNAARLLGLQKAARIMTQASGGKLPALWQYQTLPSGKSFVDGMRAGDNPIELAKTLADQWRQNAIDSAQLLSVFRG